MNRLTIAVGLALSGHLALFVVPFDIKIGAPNEATDQRTITLALNSYSKPKTEPTALPEPKPTRVKEIPPTQPKYLPKPKPAPIPDSAVAAAEVTKQNPLLDEKPEKPDLSTTKLKTATDDLREKISDSLPDKTLPEIIQTDTPNEDTARPVSVAKMEADDFHPVSGVPESEKLIRVPAFKGAISKAYPKYRDNPSPRYPRAAMQRGYQGTVIFEVYIDIAGKVQEIRISTSSGFPILDRSAENSVRDWQFVPGKKGNQPVEMWVQVPVKFVLK